MKNKLGLVSISFRKNTPSEIILAMKNAGLSFVEWGSDVHAPCDDIENLKNIVDLQEAYGIKCSSYGTYFRVGEEPASEILRYIKAAKILGTDILRIWCGVNNSQECTKEYRDMLMSECKEIAKTASEEGVTVCFECHGGTYTNRLEGALDVMNEVASDSLLMYWQPNQHATVYENVEYARGISALTRVVHVFNWRGKEKCPLMEAADEWSRYLAEFGDDAFLLLEFMPDGKIESLGREADALRYIAEEVK